MPNQRGSDFEDEIKPQDGLLRYWTFLNGETYRLFAGLSAALFGVLWCFLYLLGNGAERFRNHLPCPRGDQCCDRTSAGQTASRLREARVEKRQALAAD